jgi:hypothetical protein
MNNAEFCLLTINFFASCKKTPTDSQQSAPFFDCLSHFVSPYESSYSNIPSANTASFREKKTKRKYVCQPTFVRSLRMNYVMQGTHFTCPKEEREGPLF